MRRPSIGYLCNSSFSRESILRAYGVDARVCYLGINTKLFRPRGAPREHLIGLGSFTRGKRLELCVRAIAQISPRRPPLVWVGNHVDQAYLGEVRKLAAELDVAFEPRVLVTDDELLDLLSSASAMIYAPRLEPFGLAPLEAGACEVPVVAEGGVRETVQNGINGLLVDANPGALADAITHILEDPSPPTLRVPGQWSRSGPASSQNSLKPGGPDALAT